MGKGMAMIRKSLFYLIVIAFAAGGCSKYAYVSLNYPQPPVAYLPGDVHSIAIVNRSLPGEGHDGDKNMEAILTTEIAGSDRLASDECIKGVYDAVMGLENTELVIPASLRMEGTGTRELPELLEWEKVEEICGKEGADLLLVLENFDSNTDLLVSAARDQVAAIITTGAPKPVLPGQVKVHVTSYWRLYDPVTRKIVDQYRHDSYMAFDTHGGILPPTALPEAAYAAGRAYMERYLPSYYTVRRELYQRSGGPARQQFRAGYRRSAVANWQGATEIWEELTKGPQRKTAGRACLNMAVANEVMGHSDVALGWAQKSYEFYNNKLGRDYAKILLQRRSIEGF
jgi:hypothetical protein